MLDNHGISHTLTTADPTPHVDAVPHAVRAAADHRNCTTRADVSPELRPARWTVGTRAEVAAAVVIGALRLIV